MPKLETNAKTRGPRRRWLQYSLRTLIAVMTLVALGMGYLADRARRQERAVARVKELGGLLAFAYQFDSKGNWKIGIDPSRPNVKLHGN